LLEDIVKSSFPANLTLVREKCSTHSLLM